MRVTFAAHGLPLEWDVHIHAVDGVTVSDVLSAIYSALEHCSCDTLAGEGLLLAPAFGYAAHPMRSQGDPCIRRLDWLRESTWFAGLKPCAEEGYYAALFMSSM